jgi:hypothetical protein
MPPPDHGFRGPRRVSAPNRNFFRFTYREVRDEALTGEPAGQPLSRESFKLVQGADAVSVAEGDTDRRVTASACSALRGLRHWHVGTLFAWEPGNLLLGRLICFRAVRIGKTRSRSR